MEICGNGIRDVGEACDDGNTVSGDGCAGNCKVREGCGNGSLDLGEECDDGNLVDNDNCTSQCKVSFCGDGIVNTTDGGLHEQCDIGTAPPAPCPYGQICGACVNCQIVDGGRGPFCGDGLTQQAFEICDDGNAGIDIADAGELSCPYGADGGECTACTADCQTLLYLTGPYCGDGRVDADAGGEVCDDGNADTCGSCSADCKRLQIGPATGRIAAVDVSRLRSGEQFTLNDGYARKVFEFLTSASTPDAGVVPVPVSGNASSVASSIVAAINNLSGGGFKISATSTNQQVNLTNTQNGSTGNWPITETVADPGFTVQGMSGGGGFDCPAGAGCTSDQDCGPPLLCQGTASSKICQ